VDDRRINIGNPEEDAHLLIYGFHQPIAGGGRLLSKEFAFRLPVNRKSNVKAVCNFYCVEPQTIVLKAEGIEQSRQLPAGDCNIILEIKKQTDFVEVYGCTSCLKNKLTNLKSIDIKGIDTLISYDSHLFSRKPWRPTWSGLDLEHKKFNKATREASDYSEDINLYFGDMHVHSNYSKCTSHQLTFSEIYTHAQEVEKLDFVAITDHGWQMDEQQWKDCMTLAKDSSNNGKFIIFPSVEWTTKLYGHRNVYFNSYDAPLLSHDNPAVDTPVKLWNYLRTLNMRSMTIPHHQAARLLCDLSRTQHDLEPAIEIFSLWGNEEYWGAPMQDTDKSYPGNFAQDLLTRGWRIGFVGGSDAHVDKPGSCGITGVYAKALTLEALFEAIMNRHIYATTGAKIKLDFLINGFPMGSVLECNQYTIDLLYPLQISVVAEGTENIKKVEIIENGCTIYTKDKRRSYGNISFVHQINKSPSVPSFNNISRYFYVRVTQEDGEMAWSSPIWINFNYSEKK
jgi:hypothetical protein